MWSKLLYNQLWNIGFCYQSHTDLIKNQSLRQIKWLKHPYKDRWFADPFIYKVTDDEIIVFVEECQIEHSKGIISELVIDKQSMRLKERHVLLERDSHLSYPAIIEEDGNTYVYPENGQSGELNIYEYDRGKHKLNNPVCILKEAVADATIIKQDNFYYMVATKYPDTQEKVYLYRSKGLREPFVQCGEVPFAYGKDCSRPAGNWLPMGNQLYRPAQDCVVRYGNALSLMKVTIEGGTIKENMEFSIQPVCWRYNLGIHTLNFKDGICVVDSFGYLYPVISRFIFFLINIKHEIEGLV